MNDGIIVWYNISKGIGFLKDLNSNRYAFIHHSNILVQGRKKALKEGTIVSYDLYEGHMPNTHIARNIKLK